jgi:hypothetical protein
MRTPAISATKMEFAQVDRGEQRAEAVIGTHPQGDIRMLDIILIVAGLGFFALSIAYAHACDRL